MPKDLKHFIYFTSESSALSGFVTSNAIFYLLSIEPRVIGVSLVMFMPIEINLSSQRRGGLYYQLYQGNLTGCILDVLVKQIQFEIYFCLIDFKAPSLPPQHYRSITRPGAT